MTDYNEFKKFINALMSNAPEGYVPFLFPLSKNNKAPDSFAVKKRAPENLPEKEKYSWKREHARLSIEEAVERLKKGGNVGISARDYDSLVLVDIDKASIFAKIETLSVRTRTRKGTHHFYWTKDERLKTNIPTGEFGEVRSNNQYVVCAGSFVPISNSDDDRAGYYTVEKLRSPAWITFENLPDVFLDRYRENQKALKETKKVITSTIKPKGEYSALFDLKITDVVGIWKRSERFSHPLHPSDTGQNFCVSGELAHCWRHLVSLNAIQFLVVKSGYMDCEDAGTGHKDNPSPSRMVNDYGAIFHAWLQAKKDGLIPMNDGMPLKAMIYIAKRHGVLKHLKIYEKLPPGVYNKVLKIVKENY